MRSLLVVLLALIALPALASEWANYGNARFGYRLDIPPGFLGQGESANADGQVFSTPTAKLTVFGGHMLDGDFLGEVGSRQDFDRQEGWNITYEALTLTWASYSGERGSRILYARAISLCDGATYAVARLEYTRGDRFAFDPIIERLVRSFAGTGAC